MSNPRIYTVGGTVQASSGIYITRQADKELLRLCRARNFAYVLSARQVGKSSLMIRTVETLLAEGVTCVTIDLNRIGTRVKAEEWYRSLLDHVEQQLRLKTDVSAWWHSHANISSYAERFAVFLEEVMLAEVQSPIVFFIDEIDTTLSLDFTDDFFAVIRHLYNSRARSPQLERLSFVLIGVATPSDLIKDPVRTPFNIGEPVEVTDFTLQESLPLAAGLGLPEAQAHVVMEDVLQWTGGHPYLTQRLCRAIVDEKLSADGEVKVNQVVSRHFLGQNSIKDHNLAFVRRMLTQVTHDPQGVLTTYRKIRKGKIVSDDEQSLIKSHLKLSGVVKNEGGHLRLRNQIYKKVFDDKWVVESMPDAERRRERAAFRRGALLASMVGALVLALVSGLAVYAVLQKRRAEEQRAVANEQTRRANEQSGIANEQRALAVAATSEERNQRGVAVQKQKEAESAQIREQTAAQNERIQRSKAEANAQQALAEKKRAEEQTEVALKAGEEATRESQALRQNYEENREAVKPYRQSLYAAYMGLTQQAYNSGNIARGSDFLKADLFHDKYPDDPRRFEWYYLWHLYNSDIFTFGYADGALTDVVFSPDGNTLAASSVDNDIYLLDPVTHQEKQRLPGHSGPVMSIAYSNDGKTLASASKDGAVKLWDVATGTENAKLEITKNIRAIALSSNGKLVTISEDGNAILSDVASQKTLGTLEPDAEANPFTAFLDAAFSPNGKLLATGDDNGKVALFDIVSSNKRIASFSAHASRINAVAFSPDGKVLATASDDRSVKLWDASSCERNSCKEIARLEGHTEPVVAVAFSPDGQTLASGSRDSSARIWSVKLFKELRTIRGHTATINSVAYSPDGKTLATASEDQEVKLWNLQPARDELDTGPLAAVSQNQKLAVLMKNDNLVLWDLEHQQEIATKGVGIVLDLALSPDGKTIAVSSYQAIELFCITSSPEQTPTTKALHSCHKFETKDLFILTMAFSPDGSLLVTHAGFDDTSIKIWNVSSGNTKTIVQPNNVNSLAVSSDNKLLAVGTYGAGVKLFDIETQKEIESAFSNTGNVYAVAFSPDGNILASGHTDGGVQLRYMEKDPITSAITTGRLLSLRGYNERVTSISFSPDGNTLITGSIEGTVKLWDLASRMDMLTLEDHMTAIKSAFISTDGRMLVTASSEKIRVWRGATDEELKDKGGKVSPPSISLKDGRRLVAHVTRRNLDTLGSLRFWGNSAAHGIR